MPPLRCGSSSIADPIKDDEFFTPHFQGCVFGQECTDHVQELKTVSDLNKHEGLGDIDYGIVGIRFNSLVRSLNKVGKRGFSSRHAILSNWTSWCVSYCR